MTTECNSPIQHSAPCKATYRIDQRCRHVSDENTDKVITYLLLQVTLNIHPNLPTAEVTLCLNVLSIRIFQYL